ncbi:hypothetical protein OIU76_021846 [Salix suchowensis]|nr:hypothetical protein OIU76_021846 [Salix suchowensis]
MAMRELVTGGATGAVGNGFVFTQYFFLLHVSI